MGRGKRNSEIVGFGSIVVRTPGPEGATPGTAARWRQAAQAAPECCRGLAVGSLSDFSALT